MDLAKSCPSCHQPLTPARVRTHRGCLALIGWPFLLGGLALAGLALAALGAILGQAPPAVADFLKAHPPHIVENLARVRGLPPAVIEEFKSTGKLTEATLQSLPFAQRVPVALNMLAYGLTLGRDSEQGRAAFGIATILLMIALVAGVIATVIGLVLTARRSVLKCGGCGYELEGS